MFYSTWISAFHHYWSETIRWKPKAQKGSDTQRRLATSRMTERVLKAFWFLCWRLQELLNIKDLHFPFRRITVVSLFRWTRTFGCFPCVFFCTFPENNIFKCNLEDERREKPPSLEIIPPYYLWIRPTVVMLLESTAGGVLPDRWDIGGASSPQSSEYDEEFFAWQRNKKKWA